MDKELFFGSNELNKDPVTLKQLVEPPDPRFCNVMLAILRVLYCSGAADVLDQLRDDDELSREDGSAMGVSRNFDNLFVAKLVHMSQQLPAEVS
jgi:hypothetical protein